MEDCKGYPSQRGEQLPTGKISSTDWGGVCSNKFVFKFKSLEDDEDHHHLISFLNGVCQVGRTRQLCDDVEKLSKSM